MMPKFSKLTEIRYATDVFLYYFFLDLGQYPGDSLTHPILLTAFYQFFKNQQKPCLRIGSISSFKALEGFESGTFQSDHNLTHYVTLPIFFESAQTS